MATEMMVGKAKGGPRDGVMLSAVISWHGKIGLTTEDKRRLKASGVRVSDGPDYHPGRYQWSNAERAWVWIPNPNHRWQFPAPRL